MSEQRVERRVGAGGPRTTCRPAWDYDGDWSEANRFYRLHRAQFAVLARVVTEAGPRAVVCGDFNIARESRLFGEFMAATGLADAFGGACPAVPDPYRVVS